MYILGIESTAHTFGVGIVDKNGNLLANQRNLFTTTKGGMLPRLVADTHIEVFDKVLQDACDEASININEIELISFSQSPGIGNCLKIGATVARCLAEKLKVPLIGVNHCIAHLEIGKIASQNGKLNDAILLYASGANTQVIGYEAGKYRIFGETLDMGIGNFLDTFARYAGLGFPGGPKIQELAEKSNELVDLPYLVKGMDVAFSGQLSYLQKYFDEGKELSVLANSVQEYAFAMLIEVAERAMAHTGKTELLLGGGVACNTRLKEMAQKMCEQRDANLHTVPNSLNVDNGTMIAWAGYLKFLGTLGVKFESKSQLSKLNFNSLLEKYKKIEDVGKDYIFSTVNPYLRTDEVDINYL